MNRQVIDDRLLDDIHAAIGRGETWMAYNSVPYFLERGDMEFFRSREEAKDFAVDNYSDSDRYVVFHALFIADVLKEFTYSTDLSTQKRNEMNPEALEHLKENLKFMGFGDKLYPELEKQLAQNPTRFQLQLETDIGGKAFAAMLNFRKSDTTDNYFFNSYHASLQRRDGEIVDQAFYLNKGRGVTAKEAYNLLDGRSVFKDLTTKEGRPYQAWVQLDFDKKDKNNNHVVNQFHEAYGYNLKEALYKFPIKELDANELQSKLIQSLQKGNLQAVTFERDGSVARMFMEANPQFKTVNLYDGNMQRVQKESLEHYKLPIEKGVAAQKEDVKTDKKKAVKPDTKPEKEKPDKKNDKSLLPKKRESNTKGNRLV